MSIGNCKHGEFELTEGCPQCIAERRKAGIRPEQDEMEDGLNSEGLTLAYQPAVLAEDMAQCEHGLFVVNMCPDCIKEEQPETTALVQIAPAEDIAIKALVIETEKALAFAKARVIKSEDDKKLASDDLKLIGGLTKALTAKQTEYTKPLNDYKASILATFKEILAPLTQAEQITKSKILAYNAEVARRRQEEEEINRKRQEAAEAEMRLNGELSESVNLVEVEPEAAKRVTTAFSSVGERANWTYEVENFALLPDEYKLADTAMLNAIAKKHHDKKEVLGVRFFDKPIIARGR